jgi:two-component system phosphate regulon sensor histidine kinase PhoR
MKRIFPIITVLISLSLVGLIFFQFLWLKSANEIQTDRFKDNVVMAGADAASKLMEEDNFLLRPRRNDLLFPSDKGAMEFAKSSVVQRYSKDQISEIIRAAFDRHSLKGISFEFAVTQNTLNPDQIETENFAKYYLDSTNNLNYPILLQGASGTSLENLTKEEWLVIIVPHQKTIVLKQIRWFIWGAILFTIIITTAFFVTIRTLLRQKKLSEIKSDFINNMTHEFKTPLATISLAVDALKNEKVIADKEKSHYFTGVIKEENKRMNKQVETILQAALLDKQEVQLNLKKQSAHDLIKIAMNNIALPVEQKGGQLVGHLDAEKDIIMADEVHFTNLVNNLLDNALKYSSENPRIVLSTSVSGNQFKIKIDDNGIGMNKETLNRIFEKFYRAHTGNVHNVKGFGLGLSYVKTMVQAHKGTIKAESVLGKGSSFIVTVPLVKS